MLTWITMLVQKIESANYIVALIGACWVLYLLLFLVIRPNRRKGPFKVALVLGLIATAVCDAVWFFQFFDNFVYTNPGLKGLFWLALMPGLLLLLVMVQSYFNTGSFEHERKQQLKEEEKLRKKESRRAKFEEHPPKPPKDDDALF